MGFCFFGFWEQVLSCADYHAAVEFSLREDNRESLLSDLFFDVFFPPLPPAHSVPGSGCLPLRWVASRRQVLRVTSGGQWVRDEASLSPPPPSFVPGAGKGVGWGRKIKTISFFCRSPAFPLGVESQSEAHAHAPQYDTQVKGYCAPYTSCILPAFLPARCLPHPVHNPHGYEPVISPNQRHA